MWHYLHEGRYCIGIMIESLFKDRTVLSVRNENGINKEFTETLEKISTENVELFISTGKFFKDKPKTEICCEIVYQCAHS